MRKAITSVILAFLLVFTAVAAVGCNKEGGGEQGLTLTVGEVPASAYVGETVTLPAATATDGKDGDISASIRLTVQNLDDDGEIYREPIYEQPGNVATEFTPAGRYLDYKIVYKVTNSAGVTEQKEFDFKALEDNEAPVLSLDDADFDLEKGISVTETEDIVLPDVKGVDKPLDNDITARITVMIRDKESEKIVKTITNVTDKTPFRLTRGSYEVVYNLSDTAQNAAAPLSFGLTVSPLDHEKNLLLDEKNFTLGFDSAFNEFGELEIGKTANGVTSTGMSVATFRATKIFDQYIALNAKFDKPSADAPEAFYDISFRGSHNKDSAEPTGQEGEWPPFMIIRVFENQIQLLATVTSQVKMQYTNVGEGAYTLMDGQYHSIIIKATSVGTASDSADAKIVMSLWIDALPTEEPTISAYVTRGETNVEDVAGGVLGKDDFDILWNESTGAGWLSFAGATWAVGANGLFGDDRMTIKSLTVYPADTQSFDDDLEAPAVTASDTEEKIYVVGNQITFPSATAKDGETDVTANIKLKVIAEDGTATDLDGYTFTPTVTGRYDVYYYVTDAAGNIGYARVAFKVSEDDKVKPEINVDTSEIKVTIGQAFTLPAATVTDNVDGDILADLVIDVYGPYQNYYIGVPGDSYTLYAAGEHELVYYVYDFAGNYSEQRITVTVTGAKEGNLLKDAENFVNVTPEGTISLNGNVEQGAWYRGQYIYDQKVSMVMSVDGPNPMILINLRGEYKDEIWCKGLTMKLQPSGIYLGTYGHDVQNFASASNPFSRDYVKGKFVLFEYQTQNITVGSDEYVWVRAWYNGEEIEWTKEGVGVLNDEGGVMIKVSDLDARSWGAAHAGPFYITCLYPDAQLVVKEIRIDGKPVESDYEIPEPPAPDYEGPTGDAEIVAQEGDSIEFTDVYNAANKLGTQRMTFKLKFGDLTANGPTAIVQFLGTGKDYWGDGVALKIMSNRVYLTIGGWANGIVAESTTEIASSMFTQNDIYTYFDLLVTYIDDGEGNITDIQIDVWVGTDRNAMTQVVWLEGGDYVTEGVLKLNIADVYEKYSSAFFNANGPLNIYYYAISGTGSLEIGKVDFAANMADDENEGPAVSNYTIMNSATQKILDSAAAGKVTLTLDCNNYAVNDQLILQIAGNEFTHWGSGMCLYIFTDGSVYFAVGSMQNHTNMVAYARDTATNENIQFDCWDPADEDTHTLEFLLTYSYADDETTVTGVKAEFWYDGEKIYWGNYGDASGAVDANGDISISYETELKDWNGNVITDRSLTETDGVYMEWIAGSNEAQYNIKVGVSQAQ